MTFVRLALLLLLAAWSGVAQAQWRRAESPNFVVYSQGPEHRLRERILQLEDFNQLMRVVTSTREPPSPNKLHVYVVSGNRELRVALPVSTSVAGYYMATGEGVAAFVDGRATAAADNLILFHEYAHHFMMQYSSTAYPAWFIEGFAEYFSTARFTPRYIDVGNFAPGRIYSVTQGSWLPIQRLLSGGPDGLNREAGAAYYAQAWLMTHYFYSNAERQAALRRYLAAARTGDPVAALQTATGMTPDQFTRELRRYIAGGSISYRRMERPAGIVPPAVTVTVLPPSANDLLLYSAALRVGLRTDDAPQYLQRIRAAAARHPGDQLAQRTLAHAELLHGDRAAALRLLEPLMAAAPRDAELMYLRGRLHLEAAENGGDWDAEVRQAQRWFGQAHRADPNHFQTLYRFAQSHRRGAAATSENTLNVLLLAQQLAPQVTELRMNAASLLLARGDVDLAENMLRPIISSPHNRELAGVARQLIERARGRRAASSGGTAATPAEQTRQ